MTPVQAGPTNPANQDEVVRTACKTSLKFLGKEICGMVDWGAVHDDIARFLKRPSKRKLVLIPRGHLKSTLVTKIWAIQQMLINPDVRILIANATWDNARGFLRTIQGNLKDGSTLAQYFGSFRSEYWNQDACTISQRKVIQDAGTFSTTGIEKEQTSQHYDIIICDDVVALENCQTSDQRSKTKQYFRSLIDLLEPKGMLVVVGTRWHQDDLYADLKESGAYDVFLRSVFKEDGSALYPEKFPLEHIANLRKEKTAWEFACQYMNNPIDESITPFKERQIQFYDAARLSPLSKFLTIDPALSQSKEADNTGMIVAGMDASRRIFILDRVREKLIPRRIVDKTFELVDKWKLTRVGIENYGFQLSLKYDMQDEMRRRGKFFSIEEMRKPKNAEKKEIFISRLQPYFEQGLIYLRRDMTDLVDEIISFPKGKHDDLLDALAYQLDYLVPSMAGSKTEDVGESIDEETGKYQYTAGHWLKNFMPKAEGSLYERFMADLKK